MEEIFYCCWTHKIFTEAANDFFCWSWYGVVCFPEAEIQDMHVTNCALKAELASNKD